MLGNVEVISSLERINGGGGLTPKTYEARCMLAKLLIHWPIPFSEKHFLRYIFFRDSVH